MATPRSIDPDIEPDADVRGSTVRARPPTVDLRVVGAVFLGGLFGGLSRYLIGRGWPTPAGAFPWATFVVNVSGAFALALLLVLVLEVFPPTRYVRPALGTGFLGAYTTFSSLVVAADQLATHRHLMLATAYVAGSVVVGTLAAIAGVQIGRQIVVRRRSERAGQRDHKARGV